MWATLKNPSGVTANTRFSYKSTYITVENQDPTRPASSTEPTLYFRYNLLTHNHLSVSTFNNHSKLYSSQLTRQLLYTSIKA